MAFGTPQRIPDQSIAVANRTEFTITFQILDTGTRKWTDVTLAPGAYPILSSFSCLRLYTGAAPQALHYYAVTAPNRYSFAVDGHQFVLQTNTAQPTTIPLSTASDPACTAAP